MGLRGVAEWPAVIRAGVRGRNTTEREDCAYRKNGGGYRHLVRIADHGLFPFSAVEGAARRERNMRPFVARVRTNQMHTQCDVAFAASTLSKCANGRRSSCMDLLPAGRICLSVHF
jgi:hypothetical protein